MPTSLKMPTTARRKKEILEPTRSYFFLRTADGGFWKSPRFFAVAIYTLAPVLVICGSVADKTLEMDGAAKGLFQHFGFWVIFVTTPAIILITGLLIDRFTEIIGKPADFVIAGKRSRNAKQLREMIEREMKSLCLMSRSRYVLMFGVLVGLLYAELNVLKTFDPAPTYHHDVFDAWAHRWGYFLTKIYLIPIFTWIYPVAIFAAVHVTWSTTKILSFLCKNSMLRIKLFHGDNCGGTSRFGHLNLLIMTIYLMLFSVIAGMFITHKETYFVMQSSLAFCSALLVLQSIVGVYSIHRFVDTKKRECLERISGRIDEIMEASLNSGSQFKSEYLTLRDHVSKIHTFPYARRVKFAVEVVRFAPVAIALASFVIS